MTSTSSGRNVRPPHRLPLRKQGRPRASGGNRERTGTGPPPELREAGLGPRKALGQHFLTSQKALRGIAEAVQPAAGLTVIEVGAGLGSLTWELSAREGRVIAIELDERLAAYLRGRFEGADVTVLQCDALAVKPGDVLARAGAAPPYAVAGNLPYYIAQPLLRHFLEADPRPQRLVVMVQEEVAESIVAKPGRMRLLSVSVQIYGEPRILFRVPPSAFYPPPKVRSAVVRIDVAPEPRARVDDLDALFRVAKAGFSAKRKQLRNALAHGLRIEPALALDLLTCADIDATLRAQALTLDQWAALANTWLTRGRPEAAR